MKNKKIVVVGSINMDFVVRAPNLPNPGETVLGNELRTFPGGKGANQAIAASRMGGDVTIIGCVGKDPYGKTLVQNLQSNGVNTKLIKRTTDFHTGLASITVSSTGENSIVVVPGANSLLTPEHIEKSEEAFIAGSLLILQLEIPIPVVDYSIRIAKKHNMKVLLNPAPALSLDDHIFSNVDYLVPNKSELAVLTDSQQSDDIYYMVKKLNNKFNGVIVVTLGNNGVFVFDNGIVNHIPSYKVNVVDTTGAGDTFIAAFSTALCEGLVPMDAAKWGNAAAAISIKKEGAQSSLPYRHEVQNLLEKQINHEN